MKVLRMVMATGFGFVVMTLTGIMICAASTSIGANNCTALTPEVFRALNSSGFIISELVGFTTSASFIYYITGKWKLN